MGPYPSSGFPVSTATSSFGTPPEPRLRSGVSQTEVHECDLEPYSDAQFSRLFESL